MLEETLAEWRNGLLREGRQEGQQQLLLQLLEQRFGTLPLRVRRQVRAISSPKDLAELARQVLVAGSLAEMGLG